MPTRRLLVLALCAGAPGCGTGLALLTPIAPSADARDPDPTRSIVPATRPTEPTAPDPDRGAEEAGAVVAAGARDRVLASAASAAAWLIAGARPLIGWFGTFEENALVEDVSVRRRRADPEPSTRPPARTSRPAPGTPPGR
jgi:hypothetical protein